MTGWQALLALLTIYYTGFYFMYIKPCYIDTGRKLPWF
jgi:hypothetical protein